MTHLLDLAIPIGMFRDREEAGRLLAEALMKYQGEKDTIVLGIPRGGVVLAILVARALSLPLDVVIVRKIGAPGYEELALGAVSADDSIINDAVVRLFPLSEGAFKKEVARKQQEVKDRMRLFRGDKPPQVFTNKTVILVDDGIATGATMEMAIKIIRKQKPKKVVVAVPVAAQDAILRLSKEADEVISLLKPKTFQAISQFYSIFSQVEDDEVIAYLRAA